MKDQIISVNSFDLDQDPITFSDKSMQKTVKFQQAHISCHCKLAFIQRFSV